MKNGNEIDIQLKSGVKLYEMRVFLYGSIFSTLIHQRKLIPLHVSAIETPHGLIAFTGASGAGKSTLVTALHKRTSWPILSDDVAVPTFDNNNTPYLSCGVRRLKLWKKSFGMLELSREDTKSDTVRPGKYHVNQREKFIPDSGHFTNLFVLKRNGRTSAEALNGSQTFHAILNSVYRPFLIPLFNSRGQVFQQVAQLAEKVKVANLKRPWSEAGLHDSVEYLHERFQ